MKKKSLPLFLLPVLSLPAPTHITLSGSFSGILLKSFSLQSHGLFFLTGFLLLISLCCCFRIYKKARKLNKEKTTLLHTNHTLSLALEAAQITPWKWDLTHHKIHYYRHTPPTTPGREPTGENLSSVTEHNYLSVIHKEDRERVWQSCQELITGKTDHMTEEYRILERKEIHSTFEWVETKAIVEKKDAQGKAQIVTGSSTRISARKNKETKLISATRKAEESNHLKSVFLANMSHEIRTPLHAIVGFSDLLSSTEDETEKQEYISIIENNNTMLLQLISDILDLSKIEAGTLEFTYSDIDLNLLLKNTESSSQLKAKEKGLHITFSDFEPDCLIKMDKNRVNQVLTNLITNAIKFTEQGGITFGYRITGDHFIRFHVSDTGCGVPKEKSQDIFSRFVKLNHLKPGTGLGLSICQTIVRTMGGEMGLDSEEGKGSTFWFTIPHTPSKQEEIGTTQEVQPIPTESHKLKLLIAEDNRSNFKLFHATLKNDFEILHAWNGAEAIELFMQHKPHLILMDLSMPVMDGYEATREIRELSADTPIIAITAYAYASDEQKVMNSGFDAYISKPIGPNILKHKIIEFMHKRVIFT